MFYILAGTGYLWFTYHELKTKLNQTPSDQLLDETAQNERAFCIYAIIATVFTVS